MKTKRDQLIDALSKLSNESVRMVTDTDEVANKKSRLTGDETPEELRVVQKLALRENIFIGIDYTKLIKKMRFKEASVIEKVKKVFKGDDFKAKDTYVRPITENCAVFENTKTRRQYVRGYSPNDAPVHAKYYDKNNKDITDYWKELRAEFFKKKDYKNKSQGLEDPIRVNNFSISNIKYIEREDTGEVLYNELSKTTLDKLGLR